MARKDDVKLNINAKDKTGKAFKSAQDNMRNLASSAAILEGPLGKVAGRINALGAALGRMGGLTIASSVGFAAAGIAVGITARAAGDLEQQMLKLDAILQATGRNTETSSGQMNDFAQSLGEATLTSAEAVRGAQAALSTFSNIDTKDFNEVLTLSQDIAATFGGELRINAIKLARALDNPREGLSGLSRNILATSVAWREMVATMAEGGQKAEAQALIIGAIKEKVAGAGTAEAGGLVGAIDTLGERWTRALENIGKTGPLKFATAALQGMSEVLAEINRFLEDDTVALDKFNKELKPFADSMAELGFNLDFIDPTNLRQVNSLLKSLTLQGIDLAAAEPFLKLQRDIAAAEKTAKQLESTLDLMREKGAGGAAIFAQDNRIEGHRQIIARLRAEYEALFEIKKKDGELTALLAKKADDLISKLTKKSLTQVEQMQATMFEMTTALANTGEAGAEKRKEIESAYLAFVLRLHDTATVAAQKRADKAVLIEEAKIVRLQAVLQREEANRKNLSGFADPEANASLRQGAADEKFAMDIANADRRIAMLRAKGVEEVEALGVAEREKELLTSIYGEKRRQIEEQLVLDKQRLNAQAINDVGDLLAIVGKKSKAAAKAAEIVQKGLMIQQTIASTQAAAMRAYAELGPIAGPPVAAAIVGLGAAAVATIASTSASTGAAGGVGATGGIDNRDITPLEDPTQTQQVIINNYGAITSEDFTQLVSDALQAGSDADIITLDVNGEDVTVRTV